MGRTEKVTLRDGLKIGETVHKDAVIREATAGDVIDATVESEKLILTPEGYQLIASPTATGHNVLIRQIVSIGDYTGPLTKGMLDKLSPHDLNLLNQKADILEEASLAVTQKGGE